MRHWSSCSREIKNICAFSSWGTLTLRQPGTAEAQEGSTERASQKDDLCKAQQQGQKNQEQICGTAVVALEPGVDFACDALTTGRGVRILAIGDAPDEFCRAAELPSSTSMRTARQVTCFSELRGLLCILKRLAVTFDGMTTFHPTLP